MKTTLGTIFASLVLTLTAAASPALRIETTLADGDHIVSRPTVITDSGKQATIASGDGETELTTYALTPTLRDDGTVDIQTVITQRKGKKTDKLARRMVVPLGKPGKIQVGERVLTAKAFLVK